MTLRDEVNQLKDECKGDSKKRILLRLHVDSAQVIIDNAKNKFLDLFETTKFDETDTNDYIYLKIFPIYDSITDKLGDDNFKNTFSRSTIIAPSQVRRGFAATVTDRRAIILDLTFYLALISKTSTFNRYHPVKIVDFCRPEINDNFIYNNEKATIRYGGIFIEEVSATLQIGNQEYISKDWQFIFKESRLRFL